MLHVTNGDGAGDLIRQTGLPGVVVPWRDVLHEGPVPADLADDELREVRARFIAERGWAAFDDVISDFRRRDEAIERVGEHAEVVLWFEHDLYDQLQLIEILDRFAGRDLGAAALSLICIAEFPGVVPFRGLGQLNPDQMRSLFPTRRPVTADQLRLARVAWAAFRSPDPSAVERLVATETAALPFPRAALLRHLEQFPSVRDGLSRTERQILGAVDEGHSTPGAIFSAVLASEERAFMGDLTFWGYLGGLAVGSHRLLAPVGGGELTLPAVSEDPTPFARRAVELTEQGRTVLAGNADWIALNGVDRWLGGVHLHGREAAWRWDDRTTPGRLARAS